MNDEWNSQVSGPLNAGVYETRHFADVVDVPVYQFWTGSHWCLPQPTMKAAHESRTKACKQNVSFRPIQDPVGRNFYGPKLAPLEESPDPWRRIFQPKPGHGPAPEAVQAPAWAYEGQFDPKPAGPSALDTQVGGDHYKTMGEFQPWSVLQSWLTPEEFRGYMKGTAIAYLARERQKGGDQDVSKATHTLQGLIEMLGAK